MENVQENYIGSGVIYLNGRDVGNVTQASFSIEQETKTKSNLRGGGGNIAETTQISAVNLDLTLDSFNNENLALALRGNVDVLTSQSIADEEVTAVVPGLAATEHMIDITQVVVVKDNADTTIAAANNYEVTAAGIKVLSGGDIADGDTIKVTYESQAGSALEAMVNSGQEYTLIFDGLNDHNGKRSVVTAYRFKPSPTSGLDLIGEEYAEFQVSGGLLADTTKPAGKSQFFKRVNAA